MVGTSISSGGSIRVGVACHAACAWSGVMPVVLTALGAELIYKIGCGGRSPGCNEVTRN
jgi:hypothetical protein